MTAPSLVPVRNSSRPGDIAELVTPAEYARRQEAAQAAAASTPAATTTEPPPMMDFGALPAIGKPTEGSVEPSAEQPAAMPRVRLALMTLAAFGLAVALIVLIPAFNSRPTERPAAERLAAPSAPTATTRPSPSPQPTRAAEPIAVFWGPNGESAGQFDRTQTYTPTARFGQDWISIEVPGGGKLWTQRANLPSLDDQAAAALADLQPPPTPTPAPYVPRATPEPAGGPPCQDFGSGTQFVTVCGYGDLTAAGQQKWAETYGGHVGQVFVGITPTPSQ